MCCGDMWVVTYNMTFKVFVLSCEDLMIPKSVFVDLTAVFRLSSYVLQVRCTGCFLCIVDWLLLLLVVVPLLLVMPASSIVSNSYW